MKITTWNVKGISNPNKICLIRCQMERMVMKIFLFQETKISAFVGEAFVKYCKIWKGFLWI